MNFYIWAIKYYQKVNSFHKEKGFTLIELLVVIVIITALASIAMPTMLSQATKARQTEAKRFVASMCRGQQTYYMENSKFTDIIPQLNIGMAQETLNYHYSITLDQPNHVMNIARAKENELKSYICVTYTETVIGDDLNVNTSTFICEAHLEESDPINVIDPAECPENFVFMK